MRSDESDVDGRRWERHSRQRYGVFPMDQAMTPPPLRFPEGFRLLVCGGRDYTNLDHVWATLDRVHRKRPLGLVIHGAARGADTLTADWALERDIETWAFPAHWSEFGKAAGHKRNQTMLEVGRPQGVVAFPGGAGTADMVARAEAAGVPVMRA
jgi:hypothetical protein